MDDPGTGSSTGDLWSNQARATWEGDAPRRDQRYGPLKVLEIEGRTALWEGYDLGLQTLALDMMHADFDLVTGLLGQPETVQVTGTESPAGRGPLLSYSPTRTPSPAVPARR